MSELESRVLYANEEVEVPVTVRQPEKRKNEATPQRRASAELEQPRFWAMLAHLMGPVAIIWRSSAWNGCG
ncbi:MAG: hypothetical protein HC915_14635 [Anaerolineae bacterium]|nr:hypothetical protein [Anaerolineae bacterium]